jgi:hypothetical protein
MLGLKLETDPRWADIASKSLEDIQLVLIELPKFKPTSITAKRVTVLWLRFLKEIDDSKIIIKSDKKVIKNNIYEKEINNDNNNDNNNEVNKNNIIRYLPESFNIIFNNDIKNYYIENKLSRHHKNKTSIFTFINSIFMIIYPEYILFSDSEKESNIKTFLKKISDELFENNLYQKFLYNTNRKINKSNLQEILTQKDWAQAKLQEIQFQ